jgi:hypothetical protein
MENRAKTVIPTTSGSLPKHAILRPPRQTHQLSQKDTTANSRHINHHTTKETPVKTHEHRT